MLKQVLESVSEMMRDGIDEMDLDHGNSMAAQAYFKSAKTLLDKTIQGMAGRAVEDVDVQKDTKQKTTKPLGQDEIQYLVDAPNGKLAKICYPGGKEVEEGVMVCLDGVAMPYKEAVGKGFKTGSVL